MAWTTPRTWATSEVVTAAMMNEQVRDNETYLKGRTDVADYRQILAHSTTVVSQTGDTSEHTLYTYSVAGNTLGTNKAIRLRVVLTDYDTGTATTFRVKYGSTTMATMTPGSATGTTKVGVLDFILIAQGATNAQRGLGQYNAGYFASSTATATEDSTAAKNLVVTMQGGNNSNAVSIYSVLVELMATV